MDLQTLEIVRNRLSARVSYFARQAQDCDDQGEHQQADLVWERMRGVREALALVDSLITECDGL